MPFGIQTQEESVCLYLIASIDANALTAKQVTVNAVVVDNTIYGYILA